QFNKESRDELEKEATEAIRIVIKAFFQSPFV
ncbi:hypothetical protein LCGC14_1421860, partial [marine sediment metagenome]